jgi:hypothetical protein
MFPSLWRHIAVMFRFSLCIVSAFFVAKPIAVHAQTSGPRAVYVSTENGEGAPRRSWSIEATGAVQISGERCQGCAWHAPYQSAHQIDPERFREIAALLDLAILRKAATAPCTLARGDHNTPLVHFVVVDSQTGANDHVRLLTQCVSPEMDAARTRINTADAIMSAFEAK